MDKSPANKKTQIERPDISEVRMREPAPIHDIRNAFHWRGPATINWSGKTQRQTLLDATRVNNEATLGWSAGYRSELK